MLCVSVVFRLCFNELLARMLSFRVLGFLHCVIDFVLLLLFVLFPVGTVMCGVPYPTEYITC